MHNKGNWIFSNCPLGQMIKQHFITEKRELRSPKAVGHFIPCSLVQFSASKGWPTPHLICLLNTIYACWDGNLNTYGIIKLVFYVLKLQLAMTKRKLSFSWCCNTASNCALIVWSGFSTMCMLQTTQNKALAPLMHQLPFMRASLIRWLWLKWWHCFEIFDPTFPR